MAKRSNKTEREVNEQVLKAYKMFLKGTGITNPKNARVMFIENFLIVWDEYMKQPVNNEKETNK